MMRIQTNIQPTSFLWRGMESEMDSEDNSIDFNRELEVPNAHWTGYNDNPLPYKEAVHFCQLRFM